MKNDACHSLSLSQSARRFRRESGRISKSFWAAIFVLVIGGALVFGCLWLASDMQMWEFTRPHRIQPGTEPNHFYYVEMQSVHVGAVGQGFVARAEIQIRNGGAVPVNLDAHGIKLVDARNTQYDAAFAPDAPTAILLLPQQTTELWADFSVPAGALDDELFLTFPPGRRVRIKNPAPLREKLTDGKWQVFRKLTW